MYPEKFTWLLPDMNAYFIWTLIINAAILISMIILIIRLWNFNFVERSKKTTWTWLMLFFNIITILIYIWGIDDKLLENDNKKHLTQV